MNKLPLSKRTQIIHLLVEGNSMRSTSRIADVSINTVTKLLIDVGKGCVRFHDATVHGLTSKRIQCDEIWSFVYMKEKNVPTNDKNTGIGDVWTWVGIDADTKMAVSWLVGSRNADCAYSFMKDIKSRIKHRIQLTTDGHAAYLVGVPDAFGSRIDYAQLIKVYGNPDGETKQERKYSPGEVSGTEKKRILGKPDPDYVSTSYVERQNLTMRMSMRRFTRLTNAFSKKVENHACAIALHFVHYNFVRVHKTLRVPPAMQAGLIKNLMTIEDIAKLADLKD